MTQLPRRVVRSRLRGRPGRLPRRSAADHRQPRRRPVRGARPRRLRPPVCCRGLCHQSSPRAHARAVARGPANRRQPAWPSARPPGAESPPSQPVGRAHRLCADPSRRGPRRGLRSFQLDQCVVGFARPRTLATMCAVVRRGSTSPASKRARRRGQLRQFIGRYPVSSTLAFRWRPRAAGKRPRRRAVQVPVHVDRAGRYPSRAARASAGAAGRSHMRASDTPPRTVVLRL